MNFDKIITISFVYYCMYGCMFCVFIFNYIILSILIVM